MDNTRIKSRLENQKQLKADAVWISDCIKFIKQSTPTITDDRLVETVLTHFLTTDFNESKCNESILPSGISQMTNELLSGQFVLQIDEMVNIGESIFQQKLQQVDQLSRPETLQQFVDSKNRTIKFNLTDGVQRVFGFEYKTIPQIHNKLSPGCKIRVRDVWIRRGMLLLTPESVEILGGQSQSLLNAQKQYLERFKQTNGRMDNPTANTPNNNNINTNNAPPVKNTSFTNPVKSANPPPSKPPTSQPAKPPVTQPISISDDESDHTNTNNYVNNGSLNKQSPTIPLDNDEDDFDDDFMREIDLVEQAVIRNKPIQNQTTAPTSVDVPDIEDDLDFLSQTSRPVPVSEPTPDTKWQPKVNSMNTSFVSNISSVDLRQTFSYLCDVLLMPPNSETFLRVKAAVVNTVPPFSYTKRFSLDVKVDDGTESMIVALGDAVIRQILGISCEQFNENIRSESGKQDNQRRLKIMEQSLIGLEGVMTLELQAHTTKPTVIDIAPPTLQDISSFYSEIMQGYGMDSVNTSSVSSGTGRFSNASNFEAQDEIDELLAQVGEDEEFEY